LDIAGGGCRFGFLDHPGRQGRGQRNTAGGHP
jgi:hypothetical protein